MRAIECSKCGRWVENVGDDTKSVTCSYCVMLSVGLPEDKPSYQPTGRPAGWHFMNEYVDKDGNVFHKGKEQPKLKGTLPPTKLKPKKKTKRRTSDEILVAKYKEKQKIKRELKKQKKFLNGEVSK